MNLNPINKPQAVCSAIPAQPVQQKDQVVVEAPQSAVSEALKMVQKYGMPIKTLEIGPIENTKAVTVYIETKNNCYAFSTKEQGVTVIAGDSVSIPLFMRPEEIKSIKLVIKTADFSQTPPTQPRTANSKAPFTFSFKY